jgi:hypothetical protein
MLVVCFKASYCAYTLYKVSRSSTRYSARSFSIPSLQRHASRRDSNINNMTTPSPQEASPQKGSPRKLKPHDRLQRPIEQGRVGDEPYVPPTRAVDIDPVDIDSVDIDTRPPEERAALNLWADEFCTTGQKSYLEQVRLAR